MEDGKKAKNYNVGTIIPCPFFQVSFNFLSTTQTLESAKPAEKYAFADSTVPISLNILISHLKKWTWLFQILSAFFNNILCLVMRLFVPKIQKILMNLNFLYYPRPMFPSKHGDTPFAHFWTVLQNLKMRPCWPLNQGECSDRLLTKALKSKWILCKFPVRKIHDVYY